MFANAKAQEMQGAPTSILLVRERALGLVAFLAEGGEKGGAACDWPRPGSAVVEQNQHARGGAQDADGLAVMTKPRGL